MSSQALYVAGARGLGTSEDRHLATSTLCLEVDIGNARASHRCTPSMLSSLAQLCLLAFGPLACQVPAERAGGSSTDPAVNVMDLGAGLRVSSAEPPGVSIRDEHREGVLLSPWGARALAFRVPAGQPLLHLAYGLTEDVAAGCQTETSFTVTVEGQGLKRRALFSDRLEATDVGWRPATLELMELSGREVTLTFRAEPVLEGTAMCAAPVAVADLQLVTTPGTESAARPDIVLVVIDALRADYGGDSPGAPVLTPTLDALSARSFRFEQAFTSSPWTREAIFDLMTGAYGLLSDVSSRNAASTLLPSSLPSVASRLKAAGYRTVALFANPMLAPPTGLEEGFDRYGLLYDERDFPVRVGEALREVDPRQPLFLYIHLLSPHLPYLYFEEHTRRHLTALAVPEPWPASLEDLETLRQPGISGEMQTMVRAYYRGMVEHADTLLGQTLSVLDGSSRERPQYLVVTADHGEELYEHGGFEHGHSLHQEVLHVPLLIRPPRGHPSREGRRSLSFPVSLIDLGHTLPALAGLRVDRAPAGRSLEPFLTGQCEELPGDELRIACQGETDGAPLRRMLLAKGMLYGPSRMSFLTGQRKTLLTLKTGESPLIYDLASDPNEERPLENDTDTSDLLREVSAWQALAQRGTALLEVGLPSGAVGRVSVSLCHSTAPMLLSHRPVHQEVSESLRQEATVSCLEVRTEGREALSLTFQVTGLSETSLEPLLTLSVGGQPLAPEAVRYPEASRAEPSGTRLSTPWRTPGRFEGAPSLEDDARVQVRWRAPTPHNLGVKDRPTVEERLEALGYVKPSDR